MKSMAVGQEYRISVGDPAGVSWDDRPGKIRNIRQDTSGVPIFTVELEGGDLVLARIFELV
jgi:hypothetical protein